MNSICLIGSVWLRILSCITCLLFPVWLRILSFSTCLLVPVLPYLLVLLHLSACPCLARGSVVHHLSDWVCPAPPADCPLQSVPPLPVCLHLTYATRSGHLRRLSVGNRRYTLVHTRKGVFNCSYGVFWGGVQNKIEHKVSRMFLQ